LAKLNGAIYKFGPFVLNATERQLVKLRHNREEHVSIEPKVFDLLLMFLERPGQLILKNDFHERLWSDTHVDEAVITTCIRKLRKALDDSPKRPQYIQTVSKKGYRWLGSLDHSKDRIILMALNNSNYALRSAGGIAQDVQIDESNVSDALTQLRAEGLVEVRNEDQGARWYITEKGSETLSVRDDFHLRR